jgi:G3E family GTPase
MEVSMRRTKIDIISGFLGAGKTTFIKKLMKEIYLEEKVVILENEFGRINIDEDTLGREGFIVKPIQAGCICCSSSIDLSKGIDEIIKEFQPDRIIVEPTGIAKLSEIKKILITQEIEEICEIDHILTIVDAKNYYVRTMISKEFFEDQLRASQVIFLSKTEQMTKEKLSQVKNEINKIQPDCIVIDEVWENIMPEQLIEYMSDRPAGAVIKHKITFRQRYQNDFDRYEIVKAEDFNIDSMRSFLKEIENGIYGEIHRVKGICYDLEKGSYTIDYLPGETIIKPITGEKLKSEQSKVCLIGRKLEKEKLDKLFSSK